MTDDDTNCITIAGRVCSEPQLRRDRRGSPLLVLHVDVHDHSAHNRKDRAQRFRVVARDELAERFAPALRRGQRVRVTGRMESHKLRADPARGLTAEVQFWELAATTITITQQIEELAS